MSNPIHQLVDQLLQESGCYDPIELLRRQGILLSSDFDFRHNRQNECLDELLLGSPEAIQQQLESAADYAQLLGLEAEVNCDEPGSNQGGCNRDLKQLLNTRYHPAAQRPQLDLFMDTPGVALSNKIRQALGEHQDKRAREMIEQLNDIDPDCADLGGFEQLLEILEQSAYSSNSPADELLYLESVVAPLSNGILGKHKRAFLKILWLRLSEALSHCRFDADQPDLHRSYTDARAGEWQTVCDVIEKEENWRQQSELLRRHLEAAARSGKEQSVVHDYLSICWHFPEFVTKIPREDMGAVLSVAVTDFDDLEIELAVGLFPAWLLLRHPGLTLKLPIDLDPTADHNHTIWRIMHQLQNPVNDKQNKNLIELRAELRHLAPDLFDLYMLAL